MSKKSKFIEYVNENLFSKINVENIDPDVIDYWNGLNNSDNTERLKFTDNGKMVMKYMQSLPFGTPPLKSKDIAEGMGISARSVSGAMRRLCDDNYIEKVGKDPILYSITELGKNVSIEE